MKEPRYPKSWQRIMKLVLLWLQLPEEMKDAFWGALPQSDEMKCDAFIASRDPKIFLKKLEKHVKHRGPVNRCVNRSGNGKHLFTISLNSFQ
jgi:hypothetical protein